PLWCSQGSDIEAERWRSPAAGSGREGRADAGGSQVQGVVRRECAHGHRGCLPLRPRSHTTHGLHPHWRGETTPPVVTGMPQGAAWSYRHFLVPSWHDTLHRCLYCFDPPLYTRPGGGQQHNGCQWAGSKGLLVAQMLVRRNKEVVALGCRGIQQLPVAEG